MLLFSQVEQTNQTTFTYFEREVERLHGSRVFLKIVEFASREKQILVHLGARRKSRYCVVLKKNKENDTLTLNWSKSDHGRMQMRSVHSKVLFRALIKAQRMARWARSCVKVCCVDSTVPVRWETAWPDAASL